MTKWHLTTPSDYDYSDEEFMSLEEQQNWARGQWTFWLDGSVVCKFATEQEAYDYYDHEIGCWECEFALLDPKLEVARLSPAPKHSNR